MVSSLLLKITNNSTRNAQVNFKWSMENNILALISRKPVAGGCTHFVYLLISSTKNFLMFFSITKPLFYELYMHIY